MFIDEDIADKINFETGITEVYSEPDEIKNFLPEYEEFIWTEKLAIRVYPNKEYEIGRYDEDGYYF